VITGEEINSYNDFGKNEEVTLAGFNKVSVNNNLLNVKLPAKSVVMIEVR